jgi:cell division septal protein FtsQ
MKKRAPRSIRRLHPDTIQLIKHILLGVLLFALLAGLITAVWYGTRVERLTLREITVSGGETISHEVVRERALAQLDGTYLRLVPRRFAWTYPHDAIVSALEEIERIKDISVSRSNGTTVSIGFTEYLSDALWCEESDCYFIDNTGYAFAPAPSLQGGAFVRYSSDTEPATGQTIASQADYEATRTFTSLLETAGFDVEAVAIDAVRDVYVTLAAGGELRTTLEQTPEQTFDNLMTVRNDESFNEIAPGAFQYIDLRFGNKVFVNRTEPAAVATTSEENLVEFAVEIESENSASEVIEVTPEPVVATTTTPATETPPLAAETSTSATATSAE